MSRFLRKQYENIEPYTPGEQPRIENLIKLNTNENPYPPSPEVEKITGTEIRSLVRYPDPAATDLVTAIAEFYGVDPAQVAVGNGSDEIIAFIYMAFGEKVYYPAISYGFYPVFGDLHGVEYTRVPLKEGFFVDPEDYKGKGKMIVLANPNAPTGRALGLDVIAEFCESDPDHVILIDEAYIDFGGISAVPLTAKYENLLVVQTFSKSRSLAGARLGYAIASETLINDLERIKYSTNPYNVNTVSAAAGTAALSEPEYYRENCRKIMETREYSAGRLKELGFEVIPSVANFLFVSNPKIDGKEFYLELKERRILIRHFDNPAITQYNRITVGTREEMDQLFAAIRDILDRKEEK